MPRRNRLLPLLLCLALVLVLVHPRLFLQVFIHIIEVRSIDAVWIVIKLGLVLAIRKYGQLEPVLFLREYFILDIPEIEN